MRFRDSHLLSLPPPPAVLLPENTREYTLSVYSSFLSRGVVLLWLSAQASEVLFLTLFVLIFTEPCRALVSAERSPSQSDDTTDVSSNQFTNSCSSVLKLSNPISRKPKSSDSLILKVSLKNNYVLTLKNNETWNLVE